MYVGSVRLGVGTIVTLSVLMLFLHACSSGHRGIVSNWVNDEEGLSIYIRQSGTWGASITDTRGQVYLHLEGTWREVATNEYACEGVSTTTAVAGRADLWRFTALLTAESQLRLIGAEPLVPDESIGDSVDIGPETAANLRELRERLKAVLTTGVELRRSNA